MDEQLTQFLKALFESGHVRLKNASVRNERDYPHAEAYLRDVESTVRREFPGSAPKFHGTYAVECAIQFYHAARYYLDTQLQLPVIAHEPESTEEIYSADLVFRFLPDLIRLARAAEKTEEQLQPLISLARAWPFSSVGCGRVGEIDVGLIMSDPGLRLAYLDRILKTGDTSRLEQELVKVAMVDEFGQLDLVPVAIRGVLKETCGDVVLEADE